jgi:ubiquinone/menaquinone biosynthesis C-methylase UbiE
MTPEYSVKPDRLIQHGEKEIASFLLKGSANIDEETVKSFGEEWQEFDSFSEVEISSAGDEYFDIVTDKMVNKKSIVLDLGCGSGRWSYYLADRVAHIEALDPSNAVFPACRLLASKQNVRVTQASADAIPFHDDTFDFIMSLGVLHHIPDTQKALNDAVKKLKPGGYLLLYLYYNLDNRGPIYRILFRLSDMLRNAISVLPTGIKKLTCNLIALFIYMPFILLARLVRLIAPRKTYLKMPLAYYSNKSFHIVRNDALDRFGTPLEQRFSKAEISEMCMAAGLEEIHFSDKMPYWHLTARKKHLGTFKS